MKKELSLNRYSLFLVQLAVLLRGRSANLALANRALSPIATADWSRQIDPSRTEPSNAALGHCRRSRWALTDGRGGCQTVVGRIGEKALRRVFSSAARLPYNKRTTEAGLWGIWAVRPDAKSISYVLSTWWS